MVPKKLKMYWSVLSKYSEIVALIYTSGLITILFFVMLILIMDSVFEEIVDFDNLSLKIMLSLLSVRVMIGFF